MWGTYRDSSGVMAFSEATRFQLVPALVYQATCAKDQVIQLVSGVAPTRPPLPSQALAGCLSAEAGCRSTIEGESFNACSCLCRSRVVITAGLIWC